MLTVLKINFININWVLVPTAWGKYLYQHASFIDLEMEIEKLKKKKSNLPKGILLLSNELKPSRLALELRAGHWAVLFLKASL